MLVSPVLILYHKDISTDSPGGTVSGIKPPGYKIEPHIIHIAYNISCCANMCDVTYVDIKDIV